MPSTGGPRRMRRSATPCCRPTSAAPPSAAHTCAPASANGERYFGASGADDPLLERLSPVARAANGTAPVLLVHGRDDTVVPYAQAEDMARALRAAGRPVEFVTLVREDHWLSRSATREQMLRASADFLARHNPP